ncbi:NTP transferase domain-containing protein [Streptomyces sp. NBC_01363]|uniref:NTP transferase domain-containing protein n=1 Tax=Streptomyces sp. NBC_01363 TaxID=2903840 RepID=UPI00225BDA25|nr:NTP transferase domain-containing protein [Streptomyces sp. NBC_01363]MCX4734112.1 NTP transferase domain-containing protein [Streptomyces sp. NBC_01363]
MSDGELSRTASVAQSALAVVLAAGEGVRLRPYTTDLPKTLLTVGGMTLLERQLAALEAVGVRRVVVVAGHGWRHVKALVDEVRGSRRYALDVGLTINEDYRSTGTGGSLRCALAAPGSDAPEVVVIEGDVLLHPHALEALFTNDGGHDIRILASRQRLESSVIKADPAGTVKRIVHRSDLNVDLEASGSDEDFYNLSCYRLAMPWAELIQVLDRRLASKAGVNVERVIDGLCDEGLVGLTQVDPQWAFEVDTAADLEAARRHVGLNEKYSAYSAAPPPDPEGVSS